MKAEKKLKTKRGNIDLHLFVAGNWLRGYFEGYFISVDEAWSYLSSRFLLSFPSTGGRAIGMWVKKKNEYGYEQLLLCKSGNTEKNKLSRLSVLRKTKASNQSYL
jgi:hypothetical protein